MGQEKETSATERGCRDLRWTEARFRRGTPSVHLSSSLGEVRLFLPDKGESQALRHLRPPREFESRGGSL